MFVRIVSDLDAVPSAAPSREPLMAATLALTSSGNISPISDLDAVPSGGSLTGAADGRYPCADTWAGASPNAQPGSEFCVFWCWPGGSAVWSSCAVQGGSAEGHAPREQAQIVHVQGTDYMDLNGEIRVLKLDDQIATWRYT